MALSIKNPETERLARELARATGESLTQAVTHALRDRLVRETGHTEDPEQMLDAIREIQERVARLPILDARTDDEIIDYDENGIPT
jgi:antitoxin VapB